MHPSASVILLVQRVMFTSRFDAFDAPAAPLYAGSFCRAFLATVEAVPDYFASSLHMPLKNLAHMPKKFYLDLAGAGEEMVSLARKAEVAGNRFEERQAHLGLTS